jgi:multidrug efflux pump
MVVSLTATPMMCAHLLRQHEAHGWLYRTVERFFEWNVSMYGKTLSLALRHSFVTLLILLTTVGLNVYLFSHASTGFFPQQDTGRMSGQIIADQDSSFQAMDKTLVQMVNIVHADPAVDTVIGFTGGGGGGGGASTVNQGRMFVSLKPLNERKITVDYIMQRLRPKLAKIPGATLYLQANQDLRIGGRNSAALYQFTMRGDNLTGPDYLRSADVPAAKIHPHHRGRQHRPAEQRASVHGDLRPRRPRRASASRRS